jgi:hypothetical protein
VFEMAAPIQSPTKCEQSLIMVVSGSIQSLMAASNVSAVRSDTGYLSPESRSTPPKTHRSLRWATRTEDAAYVHVHGVGPKDLSERHSADEFGGCVNVCQGG